jgi:hypothetical protein
MLSVIAKTLCESNETFRKPVLGAIEIGKINVFEDGVIVAVLADAEPRIDTFVGSDAHERIP